jgi:hypothetical protein
MQPKEEVGGGHRFFSRNRAAVACSEQSKRSKPLREFGDILLQDLEANASVEPLLLTSDVARPSWT